MAGKMSVCSHRIRAPAAIHSVALWRDGDALKPLIGLLSDDDPQLRRLSAMALGRIGDSRAVENLLDSYSIEMDPFLRHAIIYALYEIPDEWLSGVYLGKLTAKKSDIQSYVIFIVRDDRPCDFLFCPVHCVVAGSTGRREKVRRSHVVD